MKAKELKMLLKAEGLSQRKLAKMLGLNERTVRRYVAGDLPMPKVVQLAVTCIMDHDGGEVPE